nr:MAG TPA: hypothetical protein [Caudoviricetes sp.]
MSIKWRMINIKTTMYSIMRYILNVMIIYD